MDKRIYIVLFFLVLGGLGYYFLVPRCEQPSEMEVSITQLQCAMGIDINAVRQELCEKIYNNPVCEFKNSDMSVAEETLAQHVDDCVKNSLVKNNKCVDKYKGIR